MRAAAAQVSIEAGDDIRPRWLRVLGKERLSTHENTGQAISALAGLLLQHSGNQRMGRRPVGNRFDCLDVVTECRFYVGVAGCDGRPSSRMVQAPQLPSPQP